LLTSALIVGALVLQVNSSSATGGCAAIDGTTGRPAQHISFERSGPGEGAHAGEIFVWLRVHNDTTCVIRIIGDSDTSDRIDRGLEAFVFYDRYDSKKFPYGAPEPGGGDMIITSTLRPGQTALFRVAASTFRAGYGVAVPFTYEWESSIRSFQVRHYIYLVPEHLPPDVRGKLRR
jgi:hypothetical protein